MKNLEVVVFGEAMAMFIAAEYVPLDEANHYTRAVAGAEVNVATGLQRLGFRVGWITRLVPFVPELGSKHDGRPSHDR